MTDPTRTLDLRNKAGREVRKRLKEVRGAIRKSIIDRRILTNAALADPKKFKYQYDTEKLKEFDSWIQEVLDVELLENGANWLTVFISAAYRKGAEKTKRTAERAGISAIAEEVFASPRHRQRVELLYARVFEQLKGISKTTAQQLSRELSEGMLRGYGINRIVENINNRVDKIGRVRAELLARTEIVNAHNISAITEAEIVEKDFGKKTDMIWRATIDSKTRDQHRAWHKVIMTKKQAMANIGSPNCRCSVTLYVPIPGEKTPRGKRFSELKAA